MGMVEIAITIAVIGGVLGLCGGITSIATITYVKNKIQAISSDTTNIDILNKITHEENKDGTKKDIKEQHIVINDVDLDMFNAQHTRVKTGEPNQTANTLAAGGTGALNALTASVAPIPSLTTSTDVGAAVNMLTHHKHKKKDKEKVKNLTDNQLVDSTIETIDNVMSPKNQVTLQLPTIGDIDENSDTVIDVSQ